MIMGTGKGNSSSEKTKRFTTLASDTSHDIRLEGSKGHHEGSRLREFQVQRSYQDERR
jgi:hypothetical protein